MQLFWGTHAAKREGWRGRWSHCTYL